MPQIPAEDDVQFLTERPVSLLRRGSTSTLCGSPTLSVLVEEIVDEVIDLTTELGTVGNSLLRQGEFALETARALGSIIKPGAFLEVREFLVGEYSASFLLVRTITRCKSTGNVNIRGVPFARTSSALGKLPKKRNEKLEVCFITQGRNKRKTEEALIRIDPADVLDVRYRVSDDFQSNQWRGSRVKGGSWKPCPSTRSDFVNLEEAIAAGPLGKRNRGQKYTAFDSCSGAGGVSRGAQMAGFKIRYGVDKAPEVWGTYRTNFPDAKLFQMSLDELISEPGNRNLRVDVLHFSPPCQFFSPAHTRAAAQDDENIFALFGCNELLKRTRPRIVTVEQTFGLTHGRHAVYFRPFLADFTQFGYSVRWKVVRLCTWGAAQDRKRLILIAAAPGEKLPQFPAPTHSEHGEGGLLPYNSIQRALDGVRPGDDLHELDDVKYYQPRRASYNPNRLAGTITTGASEVYFPDGTRELTLREIASLQGFPGNHTFLGTKTSIKRQIGNAFPPNAVKVLYRHIEECLLNYDGMQRYQPGQDLVLLDDSSDSSIYINDESEPAKSPDMDDDLMEITYDSSSNTAKAGEDCDRMIIDLT
ncbi:S-adenosyl-L-methionine-dependent methyltransferase [Dactylonectria estremocensis]|uniref:DNA (cytosine-5-)-methyltransferase n=1 Tax=Dactylonectria estremocensis TaxID=1079267 RepID=A0A9P9JBH9_9HYPO|nr:S-adenosyl-L-methionine-dependent methyltransferase [Dactylonectria estremocensis]